MARDYHSNACRLQQCRYRSGCGNGAGAPLFSDRFEWLPWLLQKESELGSGEQGTPAPWIWVGADAALIRGLFRALNGHCISEVPRGWTALERTACYLRCDALLSVAAACTHREGLCTHLHTWSKQIGAELLSLRRVRKQWGGSDWDALPLC